MNFIYKDIVFSIFQPIESWLELNTLIKFSDQKRIFPFYHLVTEKSPIHIKHLYQPKSVLEFKKDLEFLLKHYQPLDLHDLNQGIIVESSNKKPGFFLTFDDGLREFHEIISPILLKKGIPAACFLNTAFINNKDLFYRYKASLLIEHLEKNPTLQKEKRTQSFFEQNSFIKGKIKTKLLSINYENKNILDELATIVEYDFQDFLESEKPYLESSQIQSLINDGFYFGGHSIDHPLYNKISFEEQVYQTKTSMSFFEKEYDINYQLFSFPFSDDGVSDNFFNHFKKSEMMSFGTAGIKKAVRKNHFQRIPMEIDTKSGSSIIKSEYIYFILKSFFRNNN